MSHYALFLQKTIMLLILTVFCSELCFKCVVPWLFTHLMEEKSELPLISLQFLCLTDNIALMKETYQEYPNLNTNPVNIDSSNAVDGLKSDLSIHGGQCAYSSNYKETATWWVNLHGIASIHHITIYFMTGNSQRGMYLEI